MSTRQRRRRRSVRAGPMRRAYEEAMRRPAPVEAKQFRSESAKELVAITYELQRLAKRGTFFLDQATAGDLVGLGQQQVSVWLKEFCQRGILERVSTGRPRHACYYRYLNGAASSKRRGG